MTTQNDGIAILLANRSYLYTLLQRIFGDEPNQELLEIVTNQHTQESLRLLEDEERKTFNTTLDLLKDLKQDLITDFERTLDMLKSEYTVLLIGPNKLPAPPWESVYITKERTLFQESTLKVRRVYLKYNFLPAKYPQEADDHIALELDFMANLAGLTLTGFEEERIAEVRKLLYDQKVFLEEHLLVWIGDFSEQIQQGKTQYFYPQMAKLVEQMLRIDMTLVKEISALL